MAHGGNLAPLRTPNLLIVLAYEVCRELQDSLHPQYVSHLHDNFVLASRILKLCQSQLSEC